MWGRGPAGRGSTGVGIAIAVTLVAAACGVGPSPVEPGTGSPGSASSARVAAAPSVTPSPAPAPAGSRAASGAITTSPSAAAPDTAPTSTPPPTPAVTPTPRPTPEPTAAPAATPRPSGDGPAGRRWVPKRGVTWQWQLDGRVDLSVRAAVFDLDVDDTSARTVAALHREGRRVICYVDVGTWESYRADAARFPDDLLGRRVNGWPDERWLDIRAIDRLGPILRDRLDRCARKGFDAVEPDWLNHYEEATGFPIAKRDSIRFARWLAREAHARGLAIAQKNAPGLVASLQDRFDFAITEDCARYRECGAYRPYLDRGAAVLDAEYQLAPAEFCPVADRLGLSAIRKRLDLDAWRRTCP